MNVGTGLPNVNPLVGLSVLDGPLGDDIDCYGDLNPQMVLIGGLPNLGQALAHRLIVSLGSLFYDGDYGTNTMAWLNETIDPAFQTRARALVQQEMLKDERVLSCNVTIAFSLATDTLTITLAVLTAAGPFTYVFPITSSSASLI